MSAECMEMALVDGKMPLIRSGLPKNDVRNIRNPSLTPSAPVPAVGRVFQQPGKARIQPNHIVCAVLVWIRLADVAKKANQTISRTSAA